MQDLVSKPRLSLDAGAVALLFPEGTEAHLELKNAVLSYAATRYLKGALSDEAKDYLHNLTKSAVATADFSTIVSQHFERVQQGYSNQLGLKPGSTYAEALRRAAEKYFEETVEARVKELMEERIAKYEETMDRRILATLERRLSEVEAKVFRTRVEERMKSFLAGGE